MDRNLHPAVIKGIDEDLKRSNITTAQLELVLKFRRDQDAYAKVLGILLETWSSPEDTARRIVAALRDMK